MRGGALVVGIDETMRGKLGMKLKEVGENKEMLVWLEEWFWFWFLTLVEC